MEVIGKEKTEKKKKKFLTIEFSLQGDRLGYCWKVDRNAIEGVEKEAKFHFEQPRVVLPCKSPYLSDRKVLLDFPRHALVFSETRHEGVTEENYREKWIEHIEGMGYKGKEASVVLDKLEEFVIRSAPTYEAHRIEEARKKGKSPFFSLWQSFEAERSVVVPGQWLTEWKRIAWPTLQLQEE